MNKIGRSARRLKGRARIQMARQIVQHRALAAEVVRLAGQPSLHQLYERATSWHGEAESLVQAIFPGRREQVAAAVSEASAFCTALLERASEATLPYPDYFAAECGTLTALHAVVRIAKPSVTLETGVANGLSTETILHALAANEHGELHSVDVRGDVGALVAERTRWTLHVVDRKNPEDFGGVVHSLPPLDLFFHDADHAYAAQAREYSVVWPHLRPGGLLSSDDVDASYAFADFIGDHGIESALLLDRRKVTGFARRGSAIASA